MNHKEKSRLDRFAFALGSFGIASSYAVIPVVPNDRIAAAWDKRLGAESDAALDSVAVEDVWGVGRRWSRYLRTRGVADRTLVLFLSDNGGLSRFLRYDSPDPNDPWQINEHNAPLASGKGSALEGGLRVPMIVAWAGQDPAEPPVQPLLPIEPGSSCVRV